MFGRELELVYANRSWMEDRVFFEDQGRLQSMLRSYTDVGAADPFVKVAAGRCQFRFQDLVQLAELLERLDESRGAV